MERAHSALSFKLEGNSCKHNFVFDIRRHSISHGVSIENAKNHLGEGQRMLPLKGINALHAGCHDGNSNKCANCSVVREDTCVGNTLALRRSYNSKVRSSILACRTATVASQDAGCVRMNSALSTTDITSTTIRCLHHSKR